LPGKAFKDFWAYYPTTLVITQFSSQSVCDEVRDLLKNKIPERGDAGETRIPSLWNLIYLLSPKGSAD